MELRQPIDIALTLDISGSMSGERLNLAKEAFLNLFNLLDCNDHISFSVFNVNATRIFSLSAPDKITGDIYQQMSSIIATGGTTLYNAIKDSYDILKESININKRIIVVTDMEDNCKEDRLIQLMEQSANEGIYVRFIGISYTCNTTLAEALAHVKGSNYFVANKNEEIQKYLVNDFKFICFPCAQDVDLEFCSNNLKEIKCFGTGFIIPKEHSEEKRMNSLANSNIPIQNLKKQSTFSFFTLIALKKDSLFQSLLHLIITYVLIKRQSVKLKQPSHPI